MSETQEVAQEAQVEAQEIANQEVATPEAAQDKTATDEQATEAGSQEKDTQANEKTFTQSELDDIIKKRIAKATAIAERKASKAYAEKLETLASQHQVQKQEVKAEGKPKLEQFEKVEDYVEAVAEWKLQSHQQKQVQQAEEQRQQQIYREIGEKANHVYDLAEQDPEFDREEFDAMKELSDPMAFAILDSDIAVKLMVHLQKNPDEVIRISKLPPARQAAEIGKMEAKLSVVEKVKVSNAPAPIKPVGSRGGVTHRSPADMPQKDFEKWLYGK